LRKITTLILILSLLFCNGCIGTIIVATCIIKKKKAAARERMENELNPPSEKVISCGCGQNHPVEVVEEE
jgi:Trk-type K+ transport system membrane component